MNKTIVAILISSALLFAGCSGKLQSTTSVEGQPTSKTQGSTQESQAGSTDVTTSVEAQNDTVLKGPSLKNNDETTTLSTDLNATGIVEEDFQ